MAASKEKKSAIVSGAGFAATLWIAFDRAVREAGGSDEDIHRLGTEEGEETLRKMACVAALRGECEIVEIAANDKAGAVEFPTWKTITLGLNKDPATYRTALQAGGYRIGDYASQILEKTPIAAAEIVVDLVRVTVREMGFLRGASTAEIYAWAEAHGLKKCPAEVGPAFRLAYADQPFGEWIRVGMEPIADSDGRLSVFGLGRDGCGRWLGAFWTPPADRWDPGLVWVFVRSKQ